MATIAPAVGRLHRSGLNRLMIVVGLAAFVLGVYVVVVLGGGARVACKQAPGGLQPGVHGIDQRHQRCPV